MILLCIVVPRRKANKGPKVWWLKAGAKTIDPQYLRALLSAKQHGKDVPHFQAAGLYLALMNGQVKALENGRKRKAAEAFQLLAADDSRECLHALVDKPAVAKARAEVRKRVCKKKQDHKPAIEDGDALADSVLESAGGDDVSELSIDGNDSLLDDLEAACRPISAEGSAGQNEVDSDGGSCANSKSSQAESLPSPSSASSSSSPSSSSSSGSSSSSSSSSSSCQQVSRRVEGDVEAERQRGNAAAATVPVSRPAMRGREETSYRWNWFKLTRIFKNGVHMGWEATCYKPSHEGVNACRRTRNFGPRRTEEECGRIIKNWCLRAACCDTRADHCAYKDPSQ